MQTITYRAPAMYGDHHVTEVRKLMLAVPGVVDVHASSSFQCVEVQFDEETLDPVRLEELLAEAGYLQQLLLPVENHVPVDGQNGKGDFYRQTAAHEAVASVVGFGRQVPVARHGLWPCPGFGRLARDTGKGHPAE
jgi:copper chaperone CopZ